MCCQVVECLMLGHFISSLRMVFFKFDMLEFVLIDIPETPTIQFHFGISFIITIIIILGNALIFIVIRTIAEYKFRPLFNLPY